MKIDADIKKVLIVAGGTGGHVIPALSVAEHFNARGVDVHWIGTSQGIEARLVSEMNIPLSYIEIEGLRGHSWQRWLKAPWQITKAIFQAAQVIRQEKPNVVLCMGGYVTGPSALAAWLLRVPFVLHEQNAIEGWTNRLLSPFAKRIMVAFPKTFQDKKAKVIYTGNPVREAILQVPPPDERWQNYDERRLRVLVLGGSLGATILNETVPKAMMLFSFADRPEIWHQTGNRHLAKTQALYEQNGIEGKVTDFITDMSNAYAWADVIICRSGALTIAEIAAVGVSSILIPFPYATDDHQTHNARFLSDGAAAILLPQTQLNEKILYEILKALKEDPKKRLTMARASREFANPQATIKVAEQCCEVGCGT
jgi:UDP-N-acetylglucosamine--N-acetylmuramyl-(pentapeptide) pyrophosphoryl-undecaprenol N-acetylglucosamine transferase